eukprot:2797425-Pleurochrysis_carterae.AAC.1
MLARSQRTLRKVRRWTFPRESTASMGISPTAVARCGLPSTPENTSSVGRSLLGQLASKARARVDGPRAIGARRRGGATGSGAWGAACVVGLASGDADRDTSDAKHEVTVRATRRGSNAQDRIEMA